MFLTSAGSVARASHFRAALGPPAAYPGAVIRAFDERDRAEVERLMDAFGDEIAAMDPFGRVIRSDGFARFYVDKMLSEAGGGEGVVLIAEERGRIVGFGAGAVRERREDDVHQLAPFHDGEVTELYVVPDARNRGIGTALLGALETWFAEEGCGAVHIEVFAPNQGAIRFYRRLGYEPRDILQIKSLGPTARPSSS
jgi:ribosomal protein S18 acetylase RimI-like enzyme